MNKISKSEAINLFRAAGLNMYGNITFASQNATGYIYWANPNREYLKSDWWIILNDIEKRILHALLIPGNTLKASDLVMRADKPERIDLQINYVNDYFIDTRSKIVFTKWIKKSFKY